MNKKNFLKLSLISKGVIATCALVGFLMEMFLRKEGHWSKWDIRLKGGITVAILLTGLVYHFMLAPLKTPEEFWTIENFLVHYIVPYGALLDWALFDKGHCYKSWARRCV